MKVRIDDILVNGRHRRDMGDVALLATSIGTVGLLHPVVLTADHRLIAGERRLAAVRSLGWTEVPAVVAENVTDAVAMLIAERDENTCRKDFAPSEAVAVGRALEELERPKAKERQQDGGGDKVSADARSNSASGQLPEAPNKRFNETREIVGKAVGMSGATYRRAKTVVAAAENEPEKYAPLVAEMDRTGKVNTSYNKLREDLIERAATPRPSGCPRLQKPKPERVAPAPVQTFTKRHSGRKAPEAVRGAIGTLVSLATGLDDFTVKDAAPTPQESKEWERDLLAVISAVNRFRRQLREHGNGEATE